MKSPFDDIAPAEPADRTPRRPLLVPGHGHLDGTFPTPPPDDADATAGTADTEPARHLRLVEAPKTFEELALLAELDPAEGQDEDGGEPSPEEQAPRRVAEGPVRLDRTRYAVLDRAAYYRRVAIDCLERARILAQDRDERPLREKAALEARLLAQVDAFLCTGTAGITPLREWHAGSDSPWATWAAVFILSCIEGREPLELVRDIVEGLPHGARTSARLGAEAFAASANPQAVPVGRALLDSKNPAARGCAIELLSLRRVIGAGDLIAWLAAPEPVVQAAAVRALCRLPEVRAMPPQGEALLASDDPEVAWETARALTLWGDTRPLEAVRADAPLRDRLGARAIEIVVMAGTLGDAPVVEEITRAHPTTPELLDAVARFGHAGTWEFLAHHLADPDLGHAAGAALRTLFGDGVPEDDELDGEAWKAAVARRGLDSRERYRQGKTWTPDVAAQEADSDKHSRVLSERRHDELRARAGMIPRWLGAWGAR